MVSSNEVASTKHGMLEAFSFFAKDAFTRPLSVMLRALLKVVETRSGRDLSGGFLKEL